MKRTSEPAASSPPSAAQPLLDWTHASGEVEPLLSYIDSQIRGKRRRRSRAVGSALALLAFAAFGSWAIPWYRSTGDPMTPAARKNRIVLPDRSVAELNARTRLHTDFRYGRRSVQIDRGEVFLSVAANPRQPFLVHTPQGTVRVIGTSFNVRLSDSSAVVTLIDGAVAFSPSDPASGEVQLRPADQLVAGHRGFEQRSLSPEDAERELAWRNGLLDLKGLTLQDAVDRVAAYHGAKITVPASLRVLPLGGSCPLDDLSAFLEFVRVATGLGARLSADGTYSLGEP